ncbi:15612_t:CDS:2, partial [Gigaspora margarita]
VEIIRIRRKLDSQNCVALEGAIDFSMIQEKQLLTMRELLTEQKLEGQMV